MKSVSAIKYGPAEVLKVVERTKPVPKSKEILIKIHAATVGPADVAFRSGEPFIVRFFAGFNKPNQTPGTEFSGVVEALGDEVTQWKVGDEVCGMSALESGAHAEFLALPANGVISKKPKDLTFAQSVSICDGPMTALIFLRDKAQVKKGDKVLINGASGSVGSGAIQLAKYYGAVVTGICSTTNIDKVKGLGADFVIDYTKTDFTDSEEKYDIIFDAVGKSSFEKCKKILTDKGIYMTTIPTLGIMIDMIKTARSKGKKAVFTASGLQQNASNLEFMVKLAEQGHIKPVIDRSYALEDIVEAHKYVEKGHKKGSVIIEVGK
jgi:NADPH:quinone reductase-like Zn-dependent oxidoreductase